MGSGNIVIRARPSLVVNSKLKYNYRIACIFISIISSNILNTGLSTVLYSIKHHSDSDGSTHDRPRLDITNGVAQLVPPTLDLSFSNPLHLLHSPPNAVRINIPINPLWHSTTFDLVSEPIQMSKQDNLLRELHSSANVMS